MSLSDVVSKFRSLDRRTRLMLFLIVLMIGLFIISAYGPGHLFFLRYVGYGIIGLIVAYWTYYRFAVGRFQRRNVAQATPNVSTQQQSDLASSYTNPTGPTEPPSDGQPFPYPALPSYGEGLPPPPLPSYGQGLPPPDLPSYGQGLPPGTNQSGSTDAPPPYITLSFADQQGMGQDVLPPPPSYDEAVGRT